MSENLGIDFIKMAPYLNQAHTYPNYFNPTELAQTAPNCIITVNTNIDDTYSIDQNCVEKLGGIHWI